MEDQISISLPEDELIPDKIEVKVSDNRPKRITTTFTVTSKPKIVCEDSKADSE